MEGHMANSQLIHSCRLTCSWGNPAVLRHRITVLPNDLKKFIQRVVAFEAPIELTTQWRTSLHAIFTLMSAYIVIAVYHGNTVVRSGHERCERETR